MNQTLLMLRLIFPTLAISLASAMPRIIPTPQYFEPLKHSIVFEPDRQAEFLLGPESFSRDPKLELAAELLRRELLRISPSLKAAVGSAKRSTGSGLRIYLWNYAADADPPLKLNFLDSDALTNPDHYSQGYVIRSPDADSLWIIGGSPQAVLLGTMTVLQMLEPGLGRAVLSAAYVRDYPDFEFRAASDWLLNIEINGWAYDRGQGVEAFVRLCEAKLDRALRYKINMVEMDGFGFSIKKRPAFYSSVMLRLNRYARARGIHLYFGGYGASYGMAYEPVPMYQAGAAFMGTVFENRESYPDGPRYRCMGFPRARKGFDPAYLGSCRSNEALNQLKADELKEFVQAIEPGALYIHHEDFGGFQGTEKAWRSRCARCGSRWPNDSLAAPDGGAGGLANGYSALVRAVNSVKNPASGYDAARDCQIVLISPVYLPDSPAAGDWASALEMWRNVALQLPRSENVQIGFREVFPQFYGGERWTESIRSIMERSGLPLRVFMFFSGGADNFMTDYPLSAAPAMNALFRGARTIYNASGDFYQEPMELVNAEYSWNVHSTGFYRIPLQNKEAVDLWHRLAYEPEQVSEVFGAGGLYEAACERLYGSKAGPIMAQYYREFAWLPERPLNTADPDGRYYYVRPRTYLPLTWDRIYAIPFHWRHLLQDSNTWGADIPDESYAAAVERLKLDGGELHRRLARRWRMQVDLNRKGQGYIERALAAGPAPDAVEDLRFLRTLLGVYQPLLEALAGLHEALHLRSAGSPLGPRRSVLESALRRAEEADRAARKAFPNPIDPVGGEIGSLRKYSSRLVEAIRSRLQEV